MSEVSHEEMPNVVQTVGVLSFADDGPPCAAVDAQVAGCGHDAGAGASLGRPPIVVERSLVAKLLAQVSGAHGKKSFDSRKYGR